MTEYEDITKLAWRVFRASFKDGEAVIVEDSWGVFYYGKLKAEANGVYITPLGGGGQQFIEWDEIEFMAHDGFPVKRLMRMSQEEATKRGRQGNRRIILASLERELDQQASTHYVGGGCPFIAGPFVLEDVINRGNIGPLFEYEDNAEFLILRASNGAAMHSYDTDHLFLLT